MMNKRRKLIRRSLLIELADLRLKGVPVLKLLRDYDLELSPPHLTKQLDYYNMFKNKAEVVNSLFPEWLNDIDNIQEQPATAKYDGMFPWGEWIA